MHNLVPENFNDFYCFRSSVHEHDTRRSNNLVAEIENSVISCFTLKYLAPSVWNSLPVSVRQAEHLPLFKNRLKAYFLGNWSFFGGGGAVSRL